MILSGHQGLSSDLDGRNRGHGGRRNDGHQGAAGPRRPGGEHQPGVSTDGRVRYEVTLLRISVISLMHFILQVCTPLHTHFQMWKLWLRQSIRKSMRNSTCYLGSETLVTGEKIAFVAIFYYFFLRRYFGTEPKNPVNRFEYHDA